MKKIFIIIAVLAILALIISGSVMSKKKKHDEVYTKKAQKRTIAEEVVASGEIRPRTYVNIQSDVMGKIVKLHFKEGDRVKKGQLLVEIDKETMLRQKEQLEAALAAAEARVARAVATFDQAKLELERSKRLSIEGILPVETMDQVTATYQQAKADLEATRMQKEQARFTLNELKERIAKATIKATMSGRIVQLNMEEGEVVVAGATNIPGSVIGILADVSEMLAEVDVVESEIAGLTVGMKATVKVDALPDITFEGTVDEIAHSAFKKMDVNYFKVKILLSKPDSRLRPGMTARARVKVKEVTEAISIPIQAVVERDDKQVVWTIKDGKAHKIEVKTGISDNLNVQIEDGIKLGEEVITGPMRTIKNLEEGKIVQKKVEKDKNKKKKPEKTKTKAEVRIE